MQIVEIYTDGACKRNPGPGGWGVLIRSGLVQRRLWGGEVDTTNNRMELMAAIQGLSALTKPCRVQLTTDSTYVRDGITKWIHNWRKRNWMTSARKPVVNQDLWQRLDEQVNRHEQVEWHWVKGHSGHPENELVDELANKGVEALLAGDSSPVSFDSGRETAEQV